MDFDFRLKRKDQVTRGLIMELAPGEPTSPRTHPDAIFIDEETFGLVEPCFAKHLPGYANCGHWGQHAIDNATGVQIIASLQALQQDLLAADELATVSNIGFMFDDVRALFHRHFGKLRPQLVAMITALVQWLEAQFEQHDCVTLNGI